MGKQWDYDIPSITIWRECYRVLKPGGHLLSFGGSRTFHRIWCSIEDSGFEIRDTIMWLYGTGFPKSLNLQDEWRGWGTAIKPAYEPIIMARKDIIGTVAENVSMYGCGALNIDECRVPTTDNLNGGAYATESDRSSLPGDVRIGAAQGMFQPGKTTGNKYVQPDGRWPANIVHDGSEDVLSVFPKQSSTTGKRSERSQDIEVKDTKWLMNNHQSTEYTDSGSPSRFFYTAKPTKSERQGSKHPTIKPLKLMEWLCKLVTPSGGIILDPFAGSGTTGEAACFSGFDAILIERESEYVEDMRRRLVLFDTVTK